MGSGSDFRNKTVLITGASSGIGRACALAMAKEGASVLLVARSERPLLDLEKELRDSGANAHSYPLDISDPRAVKEAAARIEAAHGTPDILINNAGSGVWKFIHETSLEELESYMAIPFYGAFYMTRVFLKGMIERGSGHILNMSSYAGIIPFSGATAYMVARKAMVGFHEALSADLRGTGIRTSLAYFAKVESPYWSNNPGSEERVPGIASLVSTIDAERAARAIATGIRRGRKVIFAPGILRLFNLLNRWIPWFTRWLMHSTDYPIQKTPLNKDHA